MLLQPYMYRNPCEKWGNLDIKDTVDLNEGRKRRE